MNRRDFLTRLLPAVGSAVVAPAIVVPELLMFEKKPFWDIGASIMKTNFLTHSSLYCKMPDETDDEFRIRVKQRLSAGDGRLDVRIVMKDGSCVTFPQSLIYLPELPKTNWDFKL